MQILIILAGIVNLVCWIYVLVKIFQDGKIGIGIVGIICPLVAFIYGWMKADELGIKQVMLIWTVGIIVSMIANFVMIGQGGGTSVRVRTGP